MFRLLNNLNFWPIIYVFIDIISFFFSISSKSFLSTPFSVFSCSCDIYLHQGKLEYNIFIYLYYIVCTDLWMKEQILLWIKNVSSLSFDFLLSPSFTERKKRKKKKHASLLPDTKCAPQRSGKGFTTSSWSWPRLPSYPKYKNITYIYIYISGSGKKNSSFAHPWM